MPVKNGIFPVVGNIPEWNGAFSLHQRRAPLYPKVLTISAGHMRAAFVASHVALIFLLRKGYVRWVTSHLQAARLFNRDLMYVFNLKPFRVKHATVDRSDVNFSLKDRRSGCFIHFICLFKQRWLRQNEMNQRTLNPSCRIPHNMYNTTNTYILQLQMHEWMQSITRTRVICGSECILFWSRYSDSVSSTGHTPLGRELHPCPCVCVASAHFPCDVWVFFSKYSRFLPHSKTMQSVELASLYYLLCVWLCSAMDWNPIHGVSWESFMTPSTPCQMGAYGKCMFVWLFPISSECYEFFFEFLPRLRMSWGS